MPQGRTLQDRTATAILDAAAAILAEQGDSVSLADVAQAAGVSRSTLYRYFPTRDALLVALAESAAREVESRLAEVDDGSIPVAEALARLTRALLGVGAKYIALITLRPKPNDGADKELVSRIEPLFRRGIDDGTFRENVDAATLAVIYGDLINGAIARSAATGASTESASALVVNVFLNGTKR